MRVQLISDLHLEFHRDGGEGFLRTLPVSAEVLAVAGDLAPIRTVNETSKWFSALCQGRERVFYVPGNHEYYDSSPEKVDAILVKMEARHPALRVLRPGQVVEFGGLRFLGATLWFRDDALNAHYQRAMNDFELIREFVPWVYAQNALALSFFESNVRRGDVVLTHHLPTRRSIAEQFKNSSLNRFFLCDVEKLILEKRPALWMHGHTHTAASYVVGECQVACNPFGYPREPSNVIFDAERVLEVVAR